MFYANVAGFSLSGFNVTGRSWTEFVWSRTRGTRDDSHDGNNI
jgi:hypothetical protein